MSPFIFLIISCVVCNIYLQIIEYEEYNIHKDEDISIFFFIKAMFYAKLSEDEKIALAKYNPYYASLSEKLKREFEGRVAKYKMHKNFYYAVDSTRNKKIVVLLISSYAVQLTFGLKKYLMGYFDEIHIYKESFMYLGYDLSGLTSGRRRTIYFSESALLKSLDNPHDGFHIAFHEFAHAIQISNDFRRVYFNIRHYISLIEYIRNNFYLIQLDGTDFFPYYAFKNEEELYACSIEKFFEQAQEFNEKYPRLYEIITQLLNQNPLDTEYPIYRKQ